MDQLSLGGGATCTGGQMSGGYMMNSSISETPWGLG